MTDKEKVLAVWAHAEADKEGTTWFIWRRSQELKRNALGSGTTESEAWANAAKGLE